MKPMHKNYLETIYSFDDDSHHMDAFVKHKCDKEILAIIEEVSKELGISKQIQIETLPAKKGSLADWLQTTTYSNIIASVSLLVSIATLIYSRVPIKNNKSITEHKSELLDVEAKKLDIENKRLEAEKKRLELEILKKQLNNLDEQATQDNIDDIYSQINTLKEPLYDILSQNILIKKHLSNLYRHLLDYKKVTHISYTHYDINFKAVTPIREVERHCFPYFLIESDIFYEYDENARIHIYAPNLAKGKHKWRGFYEKENIVIDFNMADIDFRNGSIIDAVLRQKIKFDESGNETSRTYSVATVLQKFDGEVFTETKQGKEFKDRKKFMGSQMPLPLEDNIKNNK